MKFRNGKVEFQISELVGIIFVLCLCGVQFRNSFNTSLGLTSTHSHDGFGGGDNQNSIISNRESDDQPTILQSSTNFTTYSSKDRSNSHREEDWFLKSDWKNRMESNCFYVENFCHSTHQWFYDTRTFHDETSSSSSSSSSSRPSHPHQPSFVMKFHTLSSQDRYNEYYNYPENITVDGSIPLNVRFNNSYPISCTYSPIINHLSLQSWFNDMLGEFYVRTIFGFLAIVDSITGRPPILNVKKKKNANTKYQQDDDDDDDNPVYDKEMEHLFLSQTQIYIHLNLHERHPQPEILESQRLFTDIMSSNPLLNFRSLLDHGGCRCLKRLIFCGYRRDKNTPSITIQPSPDATTTTGTMETNNPQIVPVYETAQFMGKSKYAQTRSKYYREITRNALRHRMIDQNPMVQQQIEKTRLYHLVTYGILNETAHHQLDDIETQRMLQEWTIIGLSQRTKRRKWIDLEYIQQRCMEQMKSKKILCVPINIEDGIWATPLQHMYAHASLDGVIGIHGAQLTEAVWMRPHTLVVELLPWIHPEISHGGWVKWVHKATPVGDMFGGTDLNHIGYPLDAGSIESLYCQAEKYSKTCFTQKEHQWDNRDFYVSWELIEDILMKFVVHRPRTCKEFVNRSGDSYVLYNINCVNDDNDNNNETVVEQHFREEDWVTKKQTKRIPI